MLQFCSNIDRGILGTVHYNTSSFGFQITIGLTIDVLKRSICQRWFDINPLHLELLISRDRKEYVLDSDNAIQYMVCFAAVQQIDSIDIVARRTDAPKSLVLDNHSTTSSSNSSSLESEAKSRSEPRQCHAWKNCITGVGQRFPGGADEFRTSLKKYAIHKGFKFEYKKNSNDRIIVVCARHKDKGCTWRIHASPKFKLAKFFEIRKMVDEHTCGITFKDLRKPQMTSQVVKSTVLDLVRDRPLTKPFDIMTTLDMSLALHWATTLPTPVRTTRSRKSMVTIMHRINNLPHTLIVQRNQIRGVMSFLKLMKPLGNFREYSYIRSLYLWIQLLPRFNSFGWMPS